MKTCIYKKKKERDKRAQEAFETYGNSTLICTYSTLIVRPRKGSQAEMQFLKKKQKPQRATQIPTTPISRTPDT